MNECPNYILCGNNCCEDFFNGTSCLDCNFFFSGNKMEMLEDECCVCADNELQLGIKFPYCSHSVCIEHIKEYYQQHPIYFFAMYKQYYVDNYNNKDYKNDTNYNHVKCKLLKS